MIDLTRKIVQRTRGITHAGLPQEIRALAVQCMQDAIAVSLAATEDELVAILRAELEEAGGTPQASVWGSALRLPAAGRPHPEGGERIEVRCSQARRPGRDAA